jgi:hypothetical protein
MPSAIGVDFNLRMKNPRNRHPAEQVRTNDLTRGGAGGSLLLPQAAVQGSPGRRRRQTTSGSKAGATRHSHVVEVETLSRKATVSEAKAAELADTTLVEQSLRLEVSIDRLPAR